MRPNWKYLLRFSDLYFRVNFYANYLAFMFWKKWSHDRKICFEINCPFFTETTPYFEFVESCLRHKSEMVIYEAANAIVNLKRTTSRELIPAISVLQLFCSSPKATMRFAAVRTLNQVSCKKNKRSATLIIFLDFFQGLHSHFSIQCPWFIKWATFYPFLN